MTRIDGDWLTRPDTQAVFDALCRDGAAVLFVGGCVRNALLGEPVGDLDLASDAPPDLAMQRAGAAGLKVVPTGIDHGTVTIVSGGIPHEVTTFRKDVDTDGRHATVRFSTSVDEDAARRDFTMNALYADRHGRVIDPLGGHADLMARRVRFIGDPISRIREDFLRSLRFFRFFAWYGAADDGPDPDALAAIAAELDGLAALSRERVGGEICKLLAAPDPCRAVAAMRATGVLAQVLPGATDRALGPLIHIEAQAGLSPDPIRRLAALGEAEIAADLRLSKQDARRLSDLRDLASGTAGPSELAYRQGAARAMDVLALRAALLETPLPADTQAAIASGADQVFPVKAADLMPALSGPALGKALKGLEDHWISTGFAASRAQLLARIGGDAQDR